MLNKKFLFVPFTLLCLLNVSSCSSDEIELKLDDLQSQIDDLSEKIASLKEEETNLKTKFEENEALLKSSFESKITKINEEIDALNQQLTSLNAKFESDKEQLKTELEGKVSSLENKTNDKIIELENFNAILEQQISNLTKKHNDDKKAIQDDYNKQIASLGEECEEERTKLEEDLNNVISELRDSFETSIEFLRQQINSNKTSIDSLSETLVEEKTFLEEDYNNKISNLISIYSAKVEEIESSIAANSANIYILETELSNSLLELQNEYNSKLNLINNRIQALESVDYHQITFDVALGSPVADQIIKHGEKISEPVNPTRPGYNFEGWTYEGNPWVFYGYVVTENMTLKANWKAIDYTVTFQNEDGCVLETQNQVHYGENITYHGNIPSKPNPEDHYIYSFSGWDKELTNITGDTIITATFVAQYAPYEVKFYDEDNTLLYSEFVEEGDEGTYKGEIPTKADDNLNQLQFEFFEWEEINNSNNLIEYIAKYQSCTKGLIFENDSVYQYVGTAEHVVVPSYWNKTNIKEISSGSFQGSNAKHVIISEGITRIRPGSFSNSSKLVSVSIPGTVSMIDCYAFTKCTSLSEIIFHEGLLEIGDSQTFSTGDNYGAFEGCTSLTKINLPNSVISIWSNSFYNCPLTEVTLSSNLKNIGGKNFSRSKITSIILPNSLEVIGYMAFANCKQLSNIVIPQGVVTICYQAFSGCPITSLHLPNTLTRIDWEAFSGCSLQEVFIPSSVQTMGTSVFSGCTSLNIYCESEYKPKEWNGNWNIDDRPVVWGYNVE